MASESDLHRIIARKSSQYKDLKRQFDALTKERDTLAQDKARYAQAIKELDGRNKELEANGYQAAAELAWNEDLRIFQSALEDVIQPGVDLRAMLTAVGYDPMQHSGLTREMVQQVYEYTAGKFPQLFREESSEAEPEEQPEDVSAEPVDNSAAGVMTKAFEAGTQSPTYAPASYSMNAGTGTDRQVQPSQHAPQPHQLNALGATGGPSPSLEFKSFGQAAGRGGPAPTRVPTVGAHLRDPAWIARNQDALAQAINDGQQVISLDPK